MSEHSAETDAPTSIALCIVTGCKNRARGMVSDPVHDCWYCPGHRCPNRVIPPGEEQP